MKILLAKPRGFCAGVDRAIEIVETALKVCGPPVYVRHEIVHNRHVVESLRAKGAIFVEELSEVPEHATVIFSAHGVPKAVWAEARSRKLRAIDATCPLVLKVHQEVDRDHRGGYELILIGHADHPEVIGTLGQIPDKFHLITTVEDVEALTVEDPDHLSYVTQTTLSVDECKDIVEALHRRFPKIKGPRQEDICYATQNRQNAVKELTGRAEVVIVVGAPESSNSSRLVELAGKRGARAYLVQTAAEIDPAWIDGARCVGVTAGASAPEVLVEAVVARLAQLAGGLAEVGALPAVDEGVTFQLPAQLR